MLPHVMKLYSFFCCKFFGPPQNVWVKSEDVSPCYETLFFVLLQIFLALPKRYGLRVKMFPYVMKLYSFFGTSVETTVNSWAWRIGEPWDG